MTTATTRKIRPIEQHLVDTKDFYYAKVTMYKQNPFNGERTNDIETYEGFVKQVECGIVYKIRPEANMRSRYQTQILTVSQRLISIEKI